MTHLKNIYLLKALCLPDWLFRLIGVHKRPFARTSNVLDAIITTTTTIVRHAINFICLVCCISTTTIIPTTNNATTATTISPKSLSTRGESNHKYYSTTDFE